MIGASRLFTMRKTEIRNNYTKLSDGSSLKNTLCTGEGVTDRLRMDSVDNYCLKWMGLTPHTTLETDPPEQSRAKNSNYNC